MPWLAIALLSPFFYGFATILDNYLTNKLTKTVWVLVFFSGIPLFTPLVFLFQSPGIPPLSLFPLLFVAALIDVLYLYPYYKALQFEDTSVVVSLFSLGRIFVPILAFLFIREVLQPIQYLGFFIVILAGAALTFNRKKLRLNKAFLYMCLAALLIAIQAVIYKYIFSQVTWSTGYVWMALCYFAIVLCFLFVPRLRRAIREQIRDFRKFGSFFALEELFSAFGAMASTYAISLAPVTIIKGIDSASPFFVLAYAVLFKRFFPNLFREDIARESVLKKAFLFIIVIVGIILVVR